MQTCENLKNFNLAELSKQKTRLPRKEITIRIRRRKQNRISAIDKKSKPKKDFSLNQRISKSEQRTVQLRTVIHY